MTSISPTKNLRDVESVKYEREQKYDRRKEIIPKLETKEPFLNKV